MSAHMIQAGAMLLLTPLAPLGLILIVLGVIVLMTAGG